VLNTVIKLAFLTRSLDCGGAQRQLITLAKALDRNRFDITVICFYSGEAWQEDLETSGVRFISLEKKGRWDLIGFVFRLIRELRLLRPDILHSYLDVANLLAVFVKLFVRTRVVWGIRAAEIDMHQYDWLRRLVSKLEAVCWPLAHLIIVNSQAAADHCLSRGFEPAKLVMIPNGINSAVFKPDREAGKRLRADWRIPEHTRLVGTIGRLDPAKDLPVFLEAAALVTRFRNDVRFVCVGDGPASYALKLKKLTAGLSIEDKVLWQGARENVTSVYNALDVFCSSSRSESFPNAVAEAMACGVPCVVTDAGASGHIVGECGIVVPPGNAQALARGLISSLETVRDEVDWKARTRILENFNVHGLAKRTENQLLSLVRSGCGARNNSDRRD